MDVYLKTPGANLIGSDKDTFGRSLLFLCYYCLQISYLLQDEIKNIIDQATNDFLIRPDWALNLRCVDLVKNLSSSLM